MKILGGQWRCLKKDYIVGCLLCWVLALVCLKAVRQWAWLPLHSESSHWLHALWLFVLGVKLPFVPQATQMFNTSEEKRLGSLQLLREGTVADSVQEATASVGAQLTPTAATPGQDSVADCIAGFFVIFLRMDFQVGKEDVCVWISSSFLIFSRFIFLIFALKMLQGSFIIILSSSLLWYGFYLEGVNILTSNEQNYSS